MLEDKPMIQQELLDELEELEELPLEAQQQIMDFIAFIKARYKPGLTSSLSKLKKPHIDRGDKSINPKDLFGIWENHPRNLEDIRKTAWKRDWNL
jgi:hypothetical protein